MTPLITAMLALIVLAACEAPGESAETGGQEVTAVAIDQAFRNATEEESLWPGFDPLAAPLAIYAGSDTWLFRHPSPPEGFVETEVNDTRAHRYEGRHPQMIANTVMPMGETMTATLLAHGEFGDVPMRQLVATALHEAFHVYQFNHHSDWQANEATFFLYPDDDPELLALRRLESKALDRALKADAEQAACWTAQALALRASRFAAMDAPFSDYEREQERLEGLAYYVEYHALGDRMPSIGDDTLDADAVRLRSAYAGATMGFLLDLFEPDWRESLSADDSQYPDTMLASAIGEIDEADCMFSEAQQSAQRAAAIQDVESLRATRDQKFRDFLEMAGWRIELQVQEPLMLRRFDPMNVHRLPSGILHVHMLALENRFGSLNMQAENRGDLQALTIGAGEHPLFDGVRTVEIAGLSKPTFDDDNGSLTLTAPGITLTFDNADVEVLDASQSIRILIE